MLYISKNTLIHVVTYCYAMISNGARIRVFLWHFQYIQMFIFLLFVCVDLWGPTPECETSVSELPLLFAIAFFLIEICISSDSRNSSDTEWLTCKQWPWKVNTYNKGKNLFDLSYNMNPKAGVWVPSVFWGDKIKCSFQAFHPYLELWRDESNEFRFC